MRRSVRFDTWGFFLCRVSATLEAAVVTSQLDIIVEENVVQHQVCQAHLHSFLPNK